MEIGIYKIINKIDKKLYIGFSSQLSLRKKSHFNGLKKNRHPNTHLQNAFNKYGLENFEFSIIEICEPFQLNEREHYWATLLKTHNRKFGYNIKPTNVNDKIKQSEETKQKISKSNKGRSSWAKGKKFSKEHIEKIKRNNMGKKRSDDCKAKLSEIGKNRKFSNETKLKLKNAKKGWKITWGDKLSSSNLNSINKKRIKVIQLDKNENFIKEWSSLLEVERELKINNANLHKCCKENKIRKTKFRTLKGFIWKFKSLI